MLYGEKEFGKNFGYPTPVEVPDATTCLTLRIPANPAWWGIFTGHLMMLTEDENWQQFAEAISPSAAAEVASGVIQDALDWAANSAECNADIEAPYWDSGENAGDIEPHETQPWYGHISGGDYIEDAAVWLISSFIAASGDPAAALLYSTFERRFRLAFLSEGLPGFARVIIDAVVAGEVNLDGTVNEVKERNFLTDGSDGEHTIEIQFHS